MPQGLLATALSLALYLSGATGSSGAATAPSATGSAASAPPAATAPAASSGSTVTSSLGTQLTIGQRVGLTGTQVNLRSTPDNGATITARASRGSGATLQDYGSGWAKLLLDTGEAGWVPDWLIDSHPGFVPSSGTGSGTLKLSPGKMVWGYYTVNFPGDTDSYNSLVNNASKLSGIIPFLFSLDASGQVTGLQDRTALATAKAKGLTVLALVHNLSGPWFSSSVAHSAIGNATNRGRAVSSIVSLVTSYGYDGVNIDLEAVPASDRYALTTFIQQLAQKLHPLGKLVTISVPAKTYDSPSDSWVGAYDYAALGLYADQIMLMTYDEHYTSGPAGPVASSTWVDSVAAYAASVIPPSKVVLGVPGYGYDWSGWGSATAVAYDDAVALAKRYGRTVQWSSASQEPYFTYYKNGTEHTVWFESVDSLAPKLRIVEQRGLKGIALWRLGFEDSRIWNLVSSRWS